MKKRIHVFVSGLVQGVFFRYHTRQNAMQIGLTGFAKNLEDGRVEVVAEGDEEKLKQFLEIIKKGPQGADVEKFDLKWEDAKDEFAAFEIRRY